MKYFFESFFFLLVSLKPDAQDTMHYPKPVFISKDVNRVATGAQYYYSIKAIDSAGRPLSFSINKLPAWLVYHEADHSISGKAAKAGQFPIQIAVSNQFAKDTQNFMLTVYDKHTTNILCIGNSITNGTNKYNSYRRALWQMLHSAGYNFDFIGSWNKHHMGGNVPNPDFDMDHDGHSGWRFDDMFHPPSWDTARGNISEWLKIYSPDIVLLELGTNDVFQCRTVDDMLKDLQHLIQLLREKNSRVKIFVAQIPPLGKQWAKQKLCGNDIDYDQAIQNLNKAFVSFAAQHSEKNSPVVTVDQYSGINTDTEMYDDIHPNESGEKKMAEKWFKAISTYLTKLKK